MLHLLPQREIANIIIWELIKVDFPTAITAQFVCKFFYNLISNCFKNLTESSWVNVIEYNPKCLLWIANKFPHLEFNFHFWYNKCKLKIYLEKAEPILRKYCPEYTDEILKKVQVKYNKKNPVSIYRSTVQYHMALVFIALGRESEALFAVENLTSVNYNRLNQYEGLIHRMWRDFNFTQYDNFPLDFKAPERKAYDLRKRKREPMERYGYS